MNKRDIVHASDRATTTYADMAPRKRETAPWSPDRKMARAWRKVGGSAPQNAGGSVQQGPKGGMFIVTPSGKRYVKV